MRSFIIINKIFKLLIFYFFLPIVVLILCQHIIGRAYSFIIKNFFPTFDMEIMYLKYGYFNIQSVMLISLFVFLIITGIAIYILRNGVKFIKNDNYFNKYIQSSFAVSLLSYILALYTSGNKTLIAGLLLFLPVMLIFAVNFVVQKSIKCSLKMRMIVSTIINSFIIFIVQIICGIVFAFCFAKIFVPNLIYHIIL